MENFPIANRDLHLLIQLFVAVSIRMLQRLVTCVLEAIHVHRIYIRMHCHHEIIAKRSTFETHYGITNIGVRENNFLLNVVRDQCRLVVFLLIDIYVQLISVVSLPAFIALVSLVYHTIFAKIVWHKFPDFLVRAIQLLHKTAKRSTMEERKEEFFCVGRAKLNSKE